MLQAIANYFSQFPHWLGTMLMAMMPVFELRLALPFSILAYHEPVWEAFFFSVIGNAIPTFAILVFAGNFHHWVESKSGMFFGKSWAKHLVKIQNSFAKYKKYELWGLLFFIGSSLPGTGAYTGAVIAFILGIPIKNSWPYVFGGLLLSATVTALLTVGVDKVF